MGKKGAGPHKSCRFHPPVRLSFSVVGLQLLQMVRDGEAGENGQTLVPHVEHGTHGLDEGHVERVQPLGAHGVVEGHVAAVVVQQDADAPQVGRRLDAQLFAVVADHPGVVAAAQHPGGRVLADPLVLGGRFIGYADGVPRGGRKGAETAGQPSSLDLKPVRGSVELTMCSLRLTPPSSGGRCRCRRCPPRRSCSGW